MRSLVMLAAERMHAGGDKAAREEIAMIEVVVPNMALRVIDWAIQAHGAFGLPDDFRSARLYAGQRAIRHRRWL